jgi:two-component system, probable response regulator PhcQ
MMRRLLLVDDEINVLHALRRALHRHFGREEMRIEISHDPRQALVRVGECAFDLIISDLRMPPMSGVEFLKAVKGLQPDAVRLMLSASTEFESVVTAINDAEVFRYIAKPWQDKDLQEVIRLALARRDQLLEDRTLADEVRVERGVLSAEDHEARRLEAAEPGITKVKWGPDGAVMLDEL